MGNARHLGTISLWTGLTPGKVGDDLQFLRLNGAVVGGMVGLLLSVIRHVGG